MTLRRFLKPLVAGVGLLSLLSAGCYDRGFALPTERPKGKEVAAYEATLAAGATPPRVRLPGAAAAVPSPTAPAPTATPVPAALPSELTETVKEWLVSYAMAETAERITRNSKDEGESIRRLIAGWREYEACAEKSAQAEAGRIGMPVLEAGSYQEASENWLAPAAAAVGSATTHCGLQPGFRQPRWESVSDGQRRRGWAELLEHTREALNASGPAALARQARWELPPEIAGAREKHQECSQRDYSPPEAEWQLEKIGKAYREKGQEIAECYGYYGGEPKSG